MPAVTAHGHKTFTVKAGKRVTAMIKLSKAALKLLRRTHKLNVTLRLKLKHRGRSTTTSFVLCAKH